MTVEAGIGVTETRKLRTMLELAKLGMGLKTTLEKTGAGMGTADDTVIRQPMSGYGDCRY